MKRPSRLFAILTLACLSLALGGQAPTAPSPPTMPSIPTAAPGMLTAPSAPGIPGSTAGSSGALTSAAGASASQANAAPSGLVATPGDGSVLLTWNIAASSDASYSIYVCRGKNFSKAAASITISDVTSTSFLVMNLANEVAYSFAVSAKSSAGLEGPLSNVAYATPQKGLVIPAVAQPQAPSNLAVPTASMDTQGFSSISPVLFGTVSSGKINLSWGDVAGATSYALYRSAGDAGTVSRSSYAERIVVRGLSKEIANLPNGYEYSFAVAAVSVSGESALSNIVTLAARGTAAQAKLTKLALPDIPKVRRALLCCDREQFGLFFLYYIDKSTGAVHALLSADSGAHWMDSGFKHDPTRDGKAIDIAADGRFLSYVVASDYQGAGGMAYYSVFAGVGFTTPVLFLKTDGYLLYPNVVGRKGGPYAISAAVDSNGAEDGGVSATCVLFSSATDVLKKLSPKIVVVPLDKKTNYLSSHRLFIDPDGRIQYLYEDTHWAGSVADIGVSVLNADGSAAGNARLLAGNGIVGERNAIDAALAKGSSGLWFMAFISQSADNLLSIRLTYADRQADFIKAPQARQLSFTSRVLVPSIGEARLHSLYLDQGANSCALAWSGTDGKVYGAKLSLSATAATLKTNSGLIQNEELIGPGIIEGVSVSAAQGNLGGLFYLTLRDRTTEKPVVYVW